MEHHLKCDAKHFDALHSGEKRVELRKNDRDYNVGDVLVLRRDPFGYVLRLRVTHVLHGGQYGLAAGYVALSVEPVKPVRAPGASNESAPVHRFLLASTYVEKPMAPDAYVVLRAASQVPCRLIGLILNHGGELLVQDIRVEKRTYFYNGNPIPAEFFREDLLTGGPRWLMPADTFLRPGEAATVHLCNPSHKTRRTVPTAVFVIEPTGD